MTTRPETLEQRPLTGPRARRAGLGMLVGLVMVLLVNAALVEAQVPRSSPPGPFEYIRGDRNTVRIQLTLGIQYHQQALDILATASSREDYAQASALLQQSYVLLRFAVHGLEIISAKSKYVTDPLIDMAKDTIMEARWLMIAARGPIDTAATWEQRNSEELARALEQLHTSAALIQQAAGLI